MTKETKLGVALKKTRPNSARIERETRDSEENYRRLGRREKKPAGLGKKVDTRKDGKYEAIAVPLLREGLFCFFLYQDIKVKV